jgi:hypothetical protein
MAGAGCAGHQHLPFTLREPRAPAPSLQPSSSIDTPPPDPLRAASSLDALMKAQPPPQINVVENTPGCKGPQPSCRREYRTAQEKHEYVSSLSLSAHTAAPTPQTLVFVSLGTESETAGRMHERPAHAHSTAASATRPAASVPCESAIAAPLAAGLHRAVRSC